MNFLMKTVVYYFAFLSMSTNKGNVVSLGHVCFQFYFGKPATNLTIYELLQDIFVALLNRYLKTSRLQYATIKYFQLQI